MTLFGQQDNVDPFMQSQSTYPGFIADVGVKHRHRKTLYKIMPILIDFDTDISGEDSVSRDIPQPINKIVWKFNNVVYEYKPISGRFSYTVHVDDTEFFTVINFDSMLERFNNIRSTMRMSCRNIDSSFSDKLRHKSKTGLIVEKIQDGYDYEVEEELTTVEILETIYSD